MEVVRRLNALMDELRVAHTLEDLLARTTATASELLGVERVTIRLLDETRARLLLAARAGRPVHPGDVQFTLGEGLIGWVALNGRPLRVDRAQEDSRFVDKPGRTVPVNAFLGVPLLDDAGAIGVLTAMSEEPGRFDASHEELARLLVSIVTPIIESARLRRLSLVDPLTSALNRRGLDESLPRLRAAPASDEAPCVLLVDLDRFKSINDAHGHAIGDDVLRSVSAVLAGVARQGDDVVRLGGEEFLVVLRGASLDSGLRVAERARAAISAIRMVTEHGELRITASIGVARQRPGEGRDDLLARADAAMYRAKAEGRDRVVVDEP